VAESGVYWWYVCERKVCEDRTEVELQVCDGGADEHGGADYAAVWAAGAWVEHVHDAGDECGDERGERVVFPGVAGEGVDDVCEGESDCAIPQGRSASPVHGL